MGHSVGIDFGTSNCALAYWKQQSLQLAALEGQSTLMPSAMYVTDARPLAPVVIDEDDIERALGSEKRRLAAELKKIRALNADIEKANARLRADQNKGLYARRKPQALRPEPATTDAQLRRVVENSLRRERTEQARQAAARRSIQEVLDQGGKAQFGHAALRALRESADGGHFLHSPKSFLAVDLTEAQRQFFTQVITRFFEHLHAAAERATGVQPSAVVIGRPVRYRGHQGEKGDNRALDIMRAAARAAGFAEIDFLHEPIAAALDFERGCQQDRTVLVLDAGGGTTDCTVIRVGPSYRSLDDRSASILSSTGGRVGGEDFDFRFGQRFLLPHLGLGSMLDSGLPVPSALLIDAISVNDLQARERFLRSREIKVLLEQSSEPVKLERLLKVQEDKLMYQLQHTSEQAKIQLSDQQQSTQPLDYLDDDLSVTVEYPQFLQAIEREVDEIEQLMLGAVKDADTDPDLVYLTGGTTKIPAIIERVKTRFPGKELVQGDSFGSVAMGLGTWARRRFG